MSQAPALALRNTLESTEVKLRVYKITVCQIRTFEASTSQVGTFKVSGLEASPPELGKATIDSS